MSTQPFQPNGPTVLITANATAPSPVQVTPNVATMQSFTYRVANPEANETIFYAMGVSAEAATASAASIISAGNNRALYPLPAGAVEVVRGPANAFFTGMTRTAAANMYVTPGEGM